MDLSPKLLTDVQFREQWRGYNPDEVDEFLERVAAGVEELQRRLTDALERASTAEHRLLERSDEDEIRRTLVLAQRTAVTTIDEARAEADRIVGEAEARSGQLLGEAQAEAAQLEADIATRRRLELGDLADARTALQADIDGLRAFLDGERQRLTALLRGQIEWIESGYSLSEVPTLSDVALPAPAAPSAPVEMRVPEPIDAPASDAGDADGAAGIAAPVQPGVTDEDAVWPPADPGDAGEAAPAGSAVDELRLAREELADALRRAGVDPEDADDAPLQLEPQLPRPALFDDREGTSGDEPRTDDTAAYDALAELADLAGDEDQPLWRDDQPAGDDDPFLAELRRAVGDTEPLGPRDHVESGPEHGEEDRDDEDDEDDGRAGGLFRRGRRRG